MFCSDLSGRAGLDSLLCNAIWDCTDEERFLFVKAFCVWGTTLWRVHQVVRDSNRLQAIAEEMHALITTANTVVELVQHDVQCMERVFRWFSSNVFTVKKNVSLAIRERFKTRSYNRFPCFYRS